MTLSKDGNSRARLPMIFGLWRTSSSVEDGNGALWVVKSSVHMS